MKLVLIADAFPPMRTSAAVHMQDLACELHDKGHQVFVLVPDAGLKTNIVIQNNAPYKLIRVSSLKTKGVSLVRRLLGELLNPLIIFWHIRSLNVIPVAIDGIIWYSPTIFFGTLVKRLVKKYRCPSYLILRDLFPKWTLDLGIMKRGVVYSYLCWVANNQYKIADKIGIQSPGNLQFFADAPSEILRKLEVLWTWISGKALAPCSIDLSKTCLAGRKVFLYAGNMGSSQNMDAILGLAFLMKDRHDVGFMLVGRGDDVDRLKEHSLELGLSNTLFHDEIDNIEIPALCAQCSFGIVSLDLRHTTHNIPGKFLSYMKFGLPVLAKLNPENDLIDLIEQNKVGIAVTSESPIVLKNAADKLLQLNDGSISTRCKQLADSLFSSEKAANQILSAICAAKAGNLQ